MNVKELIMIKSYTDLEQSKKLAEILPLESADMTYICIDICKGLKYMSEPRFIKNIPNHADEYDVAAWSLAALLRVLPDYTLQTNTDGTVFVVCESKKPMISDAYDNPVDACYGMIIRLNELNLL